MEIESRRRRGLLITRVAVALSLLLAFILVPWFLFEKDIARLTAAMLANGTTAAAFAGVALLALDAFLPIPSSIVATSMGALLGGGLGTLVNAAGLTLGCLLGYCGGALGRPLARRLLGVQTEAFERWISRYGIAALLLCRAVPVLAEASVIALGAGRARAISVLGAALLADLALGALYALAGAAEGPEALPAAPAVAAAIFVPALGTAIAWIVLRRFEKGRAGSGASD